MSHDLAVNRKSYVMLKHGRVAYLKEGHGSPIILLHGIPTSSFLWRRVLPYLIDRFEVYVVDMLGYGDSDKAVNLDLSISAQADYISEFMNMLKIGRSSIVGHDIGGGVAQIMATRYLEKVERLILIDTVAYDSWPIPEIERLKDPIWDEIIEKLDLFKGFRKALLRGIYHKELVTDELVAEYVRPFRDLEGRRAYLRCARALKNSDLINIASEIERIRVPTLIIWGEGDDFQLLDYGRRLNERIKNSTLVVLPEAKHFVPEDLPEKLAELIKGFVS